MSTAPLELEGPHAVAAPRDFSPGRGVAAAVLIAALVAFTVLAFGDIITTSPTVDEPTHLAAGYSYLVTGDYRFNEEHPPLLKKIAALPLRAMSVWPPSFDRPTADTTLGFRLFRLVYDRGADVLSAEFPFARIFFWSRRDPFVRVPTTVVLPKRAFANDADAMFIRAREVMLVTGLLAIVVVFLWSAELWGPAGAALSALLMAFDPNLIANAGLVTTDVGVTALMCGALWFFWRCCRRLSGANVLGFAVFFALAQVAKFTAILLVPMIAVLAVHCLLSRAEGSVDGGRFVAKARALAIVLGVGVIVTVGTIWAAYGFRREASPGHPRPIETIVEDWYTTKSLMARFPEGPPGNLVVAGRATAHVGLTGRVLEAANASRLLPEAYVFGVAQINRDSTGRYSFLRGEGSRRGFRTYFFWTFLYKTTVPALLAIALALAIGWRRAGGALPYLLWPVVVYVAIAVGAAVNIGERHILPVYPLLYVHCGSIALAWSRMRRGRAIVAAAAIIAIAAASLVVVLPEPAPMWGRHLSYMNEIAGGPRRGYEKLVDSNFDWGQDLKRLSSWCSDRARGKPIGLVYFGSADPRAYGIPFVDLGNGRPQPAKWPKIIAISASRLEGVVSDPRSSWRDALARSGARQVGSAGYSILIYQVH